MSFKVRLYNDNIDYFLDEEFDTEEEAEEEALYSVSCHSLGGELLEMMGGEEDDIDHDDLEYEIIEED